MQVEITPESLDKAIREDLLLQYRSLEEHEIKLAKAFKEVINFYSAPMEQI